MFGPLCNKRFVFLRLDRALCSLYPTKQQRHEKNDENQTQAAALDNISSRGCGSILEIPYEERNDTTIR